MISGILLLGESRNDLLLEKTWINDYSSNDVIDYMLSPFTLDSSSFPIHKVGDSWFVHYIKDLICYVAITTKENVNVNMILEFLSDVSSVIGPVLVDKGVATIARASEILGQLVICGIPTFVNRPEQLASPSVAETAIKHMSDGCYIDLTEKMNVLLDKNGDIIEALVKGELLLQKNVNRDLTVRVTLSIPIDQLGTFKLGSDITPLPTEDPKMLEFKMTEAKVVACEYSSNKSIRLPLKVKWTVTNGADVQMQVQIESTMKDVIKDLVVVVPLPENATKTKCEATHGKTKNVPETNSVNWKFEKFRGMATLTTKSNKLGPENKKITRRISVSFSVQNRDRSCSAAKVYLVSARTRENAELYWRNMLETQSYEVCAD